MKRLLGIITVLVMTTSMVACGTSKENNEVKTEIMADDYGDAVIVAQNEFNLVFSQFDGLEIAETSTMVRTNNNNRLVVQFSYLSDNGNGVYGFEITRDDYGDYEIVRQGKDITIDNLVEEDL